MLIQDLKSAEMPVPRTLGGTKEDMDCAFVMVGGCNQLSHYLELEKVRI